MGTEIDFHIASCDEQQVKRFLDFLAVTIPFQAPKMSEMLYLAWHPTLRIFSPGELNWYLEYAAENLTQFPPLSVIRKTLMDRRNGFLNIDPFTALMNGCKNKSKVTDPINVLAERFGGWGTIGQWPVDQWEYKRKAIADTWESVKKIYKIEKPMSVLDEKIQKEIVTDEPIKNRTPEELTSIKTMLEKIKKELKNK